MKKIMAVLSLCSVFAMALAFAGCSGEQTFESKNWESGDTVVKSVAIDVEDRAVEVIPSEDGQVHIEYSESEKEYYNISVSEDGELTMTFETNKTWTDYIGTKPAAEYRKIVVALPEGLSGITVSTTNETVDVSSLAVQGEISLNSNGGNLNFEKLEEGTELSVTAKNGNITGSVRGGWDDFAIDCKVKSGKSNLPEIKEGGTKSLVANCNNGDVNIDFIA